MSYFRNWDSGQVIKQLSGVANQYLNGLGNWVQVAWDDLSGKPSTFTPSVHATSHKSAGGDAIKLDELAAPTDITTLNASASAHGLLPKLSGSAGDVLLGSGAWGVYGSVVVATANRNAAQSISHNAWNLVTFNTETVDTHNAHSLVTNPSRLTVPETGYYVVHAIFNYTSNASGLRAGAIKKNAAGNATLGTWVGFHALAALTGSGWTTFCNPITPVLYCVTGDYFEAFCFQSSGGALDLYYDGNTMPDFPAFSLHKIGRG